MSLRLNDGMVDARAALRLVGALRVATGRAEMPPEWVEHVTQGNDAERTLWLTDERLRFPPPGD